MRKATIADMRAFSKDYEGRNNSDLEASRSRLIRGDTYRDLSTIMVMPTRGLIPAKVVQSLLALSTPMNQKFTRLFIEKMEVGDAYNHAVEIILANPELSKWKYMLTIEEDNTVPTDGLMRLYESMAKFDAVSGLYWTKGDGGQPMIYGNPAEMPMNFLPQLPVPNSLQPCNGIGMGFALFKISMFKKMPKPWFRTVQEPNKAATQDLWFCSEAAKHGFKFAVDTRVCVGHYDFSTDTIW